jgi:hypothetical protein
VTAILDVADEQAKPVPVTRIADAAERTVVHVCGRIAYVEVAPLEGPAQLVASIDDGTGRIEIVFMGRRLIPGIGPGQRIGVEGRVVTESGIRRIYNPKYELTCQN